VPKHAGGDTHHEIALYDLCFVAFYCVHLLVDILNIRKYMVWVTLKEICREISNMAD